MTGKQSMRRATWMQSSDLMVLAHVPDGFTRSPPRWNFPGWFAIRRDCRSREPTSGCSTSNTEAEQSVVTDDDGRYHFFALQPGTYTITVTKTGFSALRRDGVVVARRRPGRARSGAPDRRRHGIR